MTARVMYRLGGKHKIDGVEGVEFRTFESPEAAAQNGWFYHPHEAKEGLQVKTEKPAKKPRKTKAVKANDQE